MIMIITVIKSQDSCKIKPFSVVPYKTINSLRNYCKETLRHCNNRARMLIIFELSTLCKLSRYDFSAIKYINIYLEKSV